MFIPHSPFLNVFSFQLHSNYTPASVVFFTFHQNIRGMATSHGWEDFCSDTFRLIRDATLGNSLAQVVEHSCICRPTHMSCTEHVAFLALWIWVV